MSYGGESPGASCITGIGIVCGREVMGSSDFGWLQLRSRASGSGGDDDVYE